MNASGIMTSGGLAGGALMGQSVEMGKRKKSIGPCAKRCKGRGKGFHGCVSRCMKGR